MRIWWPLRATASRPVSSQPADPLGRLGSSNWTVIEDVMYIERGYQDIVGKLRGLGADIVAVSEPDEPGGNSVIAEVG